MTWCANGAVICDRCGLFCRPVDSFAPFGGRGPEGLDPPEDEHLCAKCSLIVQDEWARRFAAGHVSGDWHKSRAEQKAAKEAGLEWVHDSGFVDERTGKDVHYRYIRTAEKAHYVPYLEWHKAHPRQRVTAPTHQSHTSTEGPSKSENAAPGATGEGS